MNIEETLKLKIQSALKGYNLSLELSDIIIENTKNKTNKEITIFFPKIGKKKDKTKKKKIFIFFSYQKEFYFTE